MKNKISIIIPTFNEEAYLSNTLQHLFDNSSAKNIEEVIVVDGGSTDKTSEIALKFKGLKFLKSQKCRSKQMNVGAKNAIGDILYFLHADSYPPKDFDRKIINEIDKKRIGCFRLRFENPSHYLLKISQWTTRINFSLFRGGDQSLFISKEDFDFLNGFDENYIIYEDVEFINRIYKKFNFKIITDYVITSERKFIKNGVWKLHFNFLIIHIKHWLSSSPQELHKYYKKHIM